MPRAAEVDARVDAALLAGRAVQAQPHGVGLVAVGPARAVADVEEDALDPRRRAPGALADLDADPQQPAGRRAADAGVERDVAVRERRRRRGRWGRGRGGRRRRRGRADERQVGERVPAAADLHAVVDPAARAGAAVEVERAVGGAGERVRLAVAVEVAAGGERGEPGPAAADRLGLAGHPAPGAVAAVEQQCAIVRHREHVGLAVAAEVPGGEHRLERAPAATDRLGLAGHPPAVAVTAVEQEFAVGVPCEHVGMPVAGEVAGREQRRERPPARADRLRRAAPPAGPVPAVHQQPPIGVAGEQVGLAVPGEVAGREQRGEAGPPATEALA